jgi:Ca2+-binding RTX toxin-like protein
MRAPLALAGLALMAAGLSLTTAPAHAAETCQGKLVTISDSDGGTVEGTDGDDVILTTGDDTTTIIGKGGDDTICLAEGVVFGGPGRDSVYVGGEVETEYLDIRDAEDLDVTIGAGGAYVQLVNIRRGVGTLDISGGAALRLINKSKVVVDLQDDVMNLDSGTYTVVGTPSIFAIARNVVLVGDRAPNLLQANQYACDIVIKGGRGGDHLEVAGSDGDLPFPDNCGKRQPVLSGQGGDDLLQGRRYNDHLEGGPGTDEARGGFGIDLCRAETKRNCER